MWRRRRGLVLLAALSPCRGCDTDFHCELNGVCTDGACVCDPEWAGETCGRIRLGEPKYAYGGPDSDVTSWGAGPPVWDEQMGKWYIFVTEIADHCGLSEWEHRSTIVRAVSEYPDGPFRREEIVLKTQAHNPYYAYDPVSKTHLLYHIGSGENDLPPRTDCVGGTTPGEQHEWTMRRSASMRNMSSAARGTERERSKGAANRQKRGGAAAAGLLTPAGLSKAMANSSSPFDREGSEHEGGTIYTLKPVIHASKSITGEWSRVDVEGRTGEHVNYGIDNPAPFVFANGTTLLLSRRYLGLDDSKIVLSRAEAFSGPYELVHPAGDFSPSEGNHEDPCIWRDARGHFHAFFHFDQPHAFSHDGINWHWGSNSAWSGGTLDGVPLTDVERPRLMWDDLRNRPGLLFFASGGESQPVATGAGQKGFTVVRAVLH